METIFTTLYSIAECDLARNRSLYTVDIDLFHSDNDVKSEDIIEIEPVSISPRKVFAIVNSPEGFGPPHTIKLRDYYFRFTYLDFALRQLSLASYAAYSLHSDVEALCKEDSDEWYLASDGKRRRATPRDVLSSFHRLRKSIPVLDLWLREVFQNGTWPARKGDWCICGYFNKCINPNGNCCECIDQRRAAPTNDL